MILEILFMELRDICISSFQRTYKRLRHSCVRWEKYSNIERIIDYAKSSGYKEMVLDIIEPLQAVIHLYKKHGFTECEPYYHNPMDDVIYMRKELIN